jgi:aspartyl-tRNA synthetase
MRKIIFGVLFLIVLASGFVTQNDIIGNWTLVAQEFDPNSNINIEKDTLKLTKDWKFSEISFYDINYPNYGANKIDLKYKLKITVTGEEYRLVEESSAIRKYIKNEAFISEIVEGTASDQEAALSSLKEIEKIIKDEAKISIPVLSATETEMVLQGINNKPNSIYTKPRKLPVSKLIQDTIPFFAPEGWRYPESAKELADFPKRLKSNDKSLLTVAKGDFNGDGLIDAAAYLMNPETKQLALFVNMSQSDGTYELTPYGNADKNTVIANGVMLAPAGEYVNSATKKKITIENPGFMIIIFDTAATLVYWEENSWNTIPLGKKF